MAIGVIAGALALLVAASPAAAKDEFEDGFKDELGRIAAHEAVGAGRAALGYILLGHPGYGHRDPYPYGHGRGDGYGERVVYYPAEVHHHHYYKSKKKRHHHHDHGYRGHDGCGHRSHYEYHEYRSHGRGHGHHHDD